MDFVKKLASGEVGLDDGEEVRTWLSVMYRSLKTVFTVRDVVGVRLWFPRRVMNGRNNSRKRRSFKHRPTVDSGTA